MMKFLLWMINLLDSNSAGGLEGGMTNPTNCN